MNRTMSTIPIFNPIEKLLHPDMCSRYPDRTLAR